MYRTVFRTSFFTLAAGLLATGVSVQAQETTTTPAEVLIKVGSGTGVSARSSTLALRAPGTKVLRNFTKTGWARVQLPAGRSATPEVVADLEKTLGVTVVPNYRRAIHATPNDARYADQWALPKIAAHRAWNVGTSSGDAVVAVLDSGVNYRHEDLTANMWINPGESGGGKASNGIDDDGNGYVDDVYGINSIPDNSQNHSLDGAVMDDNGHGSHMAGIIGGVGNNTLGVAGVNWRTKIMALKFIAGNGDGSDADAIECLEYAIEMKQKYKVNIRAVNCSFGGRQNSAAFKAAFDALGAAGILAICSAGNGETDPSNGSNVGDDTDATPNYPSAFPSTSIIAVAASDQSDDRPSFSNYGATSVDLAAPGTTILSVNSNGGYKYDTGTSQSTAFVAGAVGLIAGRSPNAGPGGIKQRILKSVDKFPQWDGKVVSGGRLNLNRAVREAIYTISGEVFHIDTDDAKIQLTGAKIFLNGTQMTNTSESGTYALSNLPPATYKIEVKMPGFTFPVKWVSLPNTAGAPAAPDAIRHFQGTASATEYYEVTGTAYDQNGIPKPGVSIYWNSLTQPVATTDQNGQYLIRQRIAGTNVVSARGFNLIWTPDVPSLNLPTTGQSYSPNGVVNFNARVPDTTAPIVTIISPVDGSTLTSPSISANGSASDATGVAEMYFILYRNTASTTEYYDWAQKFWVTDPEAPGIVFAKAADGSTNYNWKITLPVLSDNTYTLIAWAKDVEGNEAAGGAGEAYSVFTIDANAN